VLNAPPTPLVSVSPARDYLLLVEWLRYPPIADLAQPMLGLAGERINPNTNGPHRTTRYTGYRLKSIADGSERPVLIQKDGNLGSPSWSPDGSRFAFTRTLENGIELWIADVKSGAARPVPGLKVNAAGGGALEWLPEGRGLLVRTVPANRGTAPAAPRAPEGPVIQESAGTRSPVRTFQDLLRNPHDEALFDHYFTSQLAEVDPESLRSAHVGRPALIDSVQASPDGRHLLVRRMKRPYSYLFPAYAFPREVEVWDRSGRVERTLASLPLQDRVPIGGVPTGPRGHTWVPTEPATLAWTEALDEGDPRKKVAHRDRLLTLAAPFTGEGRELARTEHRFAGLTWIEGGQAFLREFDRDRRWSRTFLLAPNLQPATSNQQLRLVWDRSSQDRYNDPGSPETRLLPSGHRVVLRSGDHIFLTGAGASPEGDRPFLDRFDLKTLKAERLFRSEPGRYESVTTLLGEDGRRFLTRRETASEPPNYFVRSGNSVRPLTDFRDPTPQLRGIKKQIVTYKRADGVPLSFTLYLPPDYRPGTRLPTVMWAYPREFSGADTAGQVSGSADRFTTIGGTSHLFFLLQGYAVLDDAAMPVIGDPETVNDTFIEQIVAGAKAAIDKAEEMGVTDRNRVGVGGHSYGAFMTANLLAHSDLFRAGIARSGAYNRTLTPFGFQSERRTLWEAPEVYTRLSPFMHAHKINEPVLIIHGESDDNPGTFPIQSERLFHAIQGNGGRARYVVLPHESHGYQARESVEHTLFEMISWFDRHVKGAGEMR
jgi:dipeptidyl aminopeptidase/acylaminoacyl peptidase